MTTVLPLTGLVEAMAVFSFLTGGKLGVTLSGRTGFVLNRKLLSISEGDRIIRRKSNEVIG